MSKTLSQQILKHTEETAQNTRAIKVMLEQHFALDAVTAQPAQAQTVLHDNLEQFVMPVTVDSEPEPAPTQPVEPVPAVAEQGDAKPQTKAEEILARFKQRIGGGA